MVRKLGYVEGAFYNRYSYIFMNKVVGIMKYEKPIMEISLFETKDIITNSLEIGSGGGTEIDPNNFTQ